MNERNRMVASRSPAVMDASHYEQFRKFLEQACGIVLGDNKQYLVSSRLTRLMAEHGVADLSELVARIQRPGGGGLREAVIDAMTTNETLWFRDTYPYKILKERLLPELNQQRGGAIRVWSAACSSGQEPYSISMIVEETKLTAMGSMMRPVEIVATDLSRSMLKVCEQGVYDELSLNRGLSPERKQRFFDAQPGGTWKVKPHLKQRISFRTINLMESYLSMGKFDIVFCRNVLIYFSAEKKLDILRRIHGVLKPGGYLILGASEGLTGVSDYYEMVQCSPGIIYRAR